MCSGVLEYSEFRTYNLLECMGHLMFDVGFELHDVVLPGGK